MNLLIVSNVFPPGFVGGYELGALECARGLLAAGHKIGVLTSDYFQDDAGELGDLNVERSLECHYVSHRLNSPHAAIDEAEGFYVNYANIRKIGSAIRRFDPDVVLLWNLMGLGTLGIIEFLQANGVPVVLYLMDNIFAKVDRKSAVFDKYAKVFGQPRFGAATKVIAISSNVVNEVAETLGFAPPDVSYIPAWVHASHTIGQPAWREEGAPVRFVVCSRVAPHKGVDIIADAAEELVRRGERAFSIDVYGAGQVAPFLQRVQSKGLAGHIRYLGCKPKADMLALFPQYDALLFPTWAREPFGFNVTEAAGAGCFPIMTAGIGASEWFVDNVDCMKIARTAQELAGAMHRTIQMDAAERWKMRGAALQTAKSYLTFDRWLTVIERLCEEVRSRKDSKALELSRSTQSAFLFLYQLWREA
jgi:glycosyltransferase involved in cell wall biosynthesis